MKMTSASKICLFLIAIAIAAPTLLLLKFHNDSIKRSERPPTQAQIDDFFKVSGIAPAPKEKIVYFLHGPDWEDPTNIFAMDKKVEFYKVALKLSEIEAKQLVSNEIFSSKAVLDRPPSFAKKLPQISLIKDKSYLSLLGSSPGIKAGNLEATIDARGDLYYVYIELTLLNDGSGNSVPASAAAN